MRWWREWYKNSMGNACKMCVMCRGLQLLGIRQNLRWRGKTLQSRCNMFSSFRELYRGNYFRIILDSYDGKMWRLKRKTYPELFVFFASDCLTYMVKRMVLYALQPFLAIHHEKNIYINTLNIHHLAYCLSNSFLSNRI